MPNRPMRHALVLALLAAAAGAQGQDAPELDSDFAKFSYGVGMQVGRSLKEQGLDEIDAQALGLGVADVINGSEPRISLDDLRAALQVYRAKRESEQSAAADVNKATGESFLASNGKAEGVVTLDSGVQYRILTEGTGARPAASDQVRVHYSGKLLDGTEFDSSYQRGQPAEFQVGKVIQGWQQVLQLMPTGSKWEVWIPADSAYGMRGPGAIGPNQTLNFVIELLTVL
jgi:FKBP-type peptidyl-prolyl cis-trans isomerase FklB